MRIRSWCSGSPSGTSGAILCAATTGAYFCAATGILRRAQATTHWRFFDEFEALFPDVDLQRKRFITYSNGIYCSGSVNAIRDIIVHLINDMYGDQIANEVSRHFMHELKNPMPQNCCSRVRKGVIMMSVSFRYRNGYGAVSRNQPIWRTWPSILA